MLVLRDRFPTDNCITAMVATMAVPALARDALTATLKVRVKAQRNQHKHAHRMLVGKVAPPIFCFICFLYFIAKDVLFAAHWCT